MAALFRCLSQQQRSGAPHLPGLWTHFCSPHFGLDTALLGLLLFHAPSQDPTIRKKKKKKEKGRLEFLRDQASAKHVKAPAMLYSFLRLSSDDPNHMRDWVDVWRPREEAGHPQPSLLYFFSALRSGSIPLCPRDIWRTSFTKTPIGLPPFPSPERSNAPIKRPGYTYGCTWVISGLTAYLRQSVRGQRVHGEQQVAQMF